MARTELKRRSKCVSEQTRNHNHELARRIEEESAVLLKNDGFFPLKDIREILLIGDLADKPRIQGGGSSHIHTDRVDNFIEEFEKQHIKVHFARGYVSNTFHRDSRLEKEALEKLQKAKKQNIPVLFVGGLTDIAEGEGYDRESFELPANQTALLEQILCIDDKIGFISVGGSPYNMKLPSKCKGLLQLYLGGEAAAVACVRLVTGVVNPSGKLAESIPYCEKDVSSYGYFGRQEGRATFG